MTWNPASVVVVANPAAAGGRVGRPGRVWRIQKHLGAVRVVGLKATGCVPSRPRGRRGRAPWSVPRWGRHARCGRVGDHVGFAGSAPFASESSLQVRGRLPADPAAWRDPRQCARSHAVRRRRQPRCRTVRWTESATRRTDGSTSRADRRPGRPTRESVEQALRRHDHVLLRDHPPCSSTSPRASAPHGRGHRRDRTHERVCNSRFAGGE